VPDAPVEPCVGGGGGGAAGADAWLPEPALPDEPLDRVAPPLELPELVRLPELT
jgi:hypothetical protein